MIEDKIKEGYGYTITSGEHTETTRALVMMTGSGGAKEWIKSCRQAGWSDSLIEETIKINMNGKEYSLKEIGWRKKTVLDELEEKVFTALGEASVCWEDGKTPHGVFDEKKATEIGKRLIEEIKALVVI